MIFINQPLKEIFTQIRIELEKIYGDNMVHLILYGSQARGDATTDSDIDILIVLKTENINAWEEIEKTGKFIADICLQNNVVISRNFISSSRFQTENSPFLLNVRREGIFI